MKYLKLKKTSPEERRKKKENERRNKSRLEREATKKISWVNVKTKKISWTKRRIELIFAIMHKRLSYDHERKGCEHVSGWLHFYRVLTYGDPYADLLTYNNSQWMCAMLLWRRHNYHSWSFERFPEDTR